MAASKCLGHLGDTRAPGITWPYIFLGKPGSFSAWHVEDDLLSSVNIRLHGCKFWWSIPVSESVKFDEYLQERGGETECCMPSQHKGTY